MIILKEKIFGKNILTNFINQHVRKMTKNLQMWETLLSL